MMPVRFNLLDKSGFPVVLAVDTVKYEYDSPTLK